MKHNTHLKAGDILDKLGVFQVIIDKMNNADNEQLCNIFESCFDNCIDMRLKYDKKQDFFVIYEETNLN